MKKHAERFRTEIDGAEFVILKGTGHVPMWDAPQLVVDTINEFVGRHTAAAAPVRGGRRARRPAPRAIPRLDRAQLDRDQVAALVVDLERRVREGEPGVEHRLHAPADRVAVDSSPTRTWADRAGKPLVISQTWRSWTSRTPGWPTRASPICWGSRWAGAASRKTRPDALTRA